jgi:hypothetical protein
MGYPSASTTGSTKTLRASDTRSSSQVDFNDDEGGKKTSSKFLNMVKCKLKIIQLNFFKAFFLLFFFKAIWSTRELTDTTKSNDIHVKTTLRELIIYILYLIILCICK